MTDTPPQAITGLAIHRCTIGARTDWLEFQDGPEVELPAALIEPVLGGALLPDEDAMPVPITLTMGLALAEESPAPPP
jgi:hypothetical protein